MKDPSKKRNRIIDLILILLVIILGFFLYTLIGNEWTLSGSSGDLGPFEQIANSMGAFGRNLSAMFGRMLP
jgi:hypothetical protein